jgi:hypothetical protein
VRRHFIDAPGTDASSAVRFADVHAIFAPRSPEVHPMKVQVDLGVSIT